MEGIHVQLLGRPQVLVDGAAQPPPKGAKPWGLLAYLASTGRAHLRAELAELLFGEAGDPLGALRWNLAALRRLLARPDALKGEVVGLDLTDITVDVHQVDDGTLVPDEPAAFELLAGISFPDSPAFEMWLTGERARLRRRATSVLRESALRALADGEGDAAVARAQALVAVDPFDEGHHALLIRAHVTGGDNAAARAQLDHCRSLLRRELSIEPGPAVIAAAHLAVVDEATAPATDRATVEARLVVSWRSFLAGSVDHGTDLGRGVVAMADRLGDEGMAIAARLSLAGMLSIAVRGWDEAATNATEALQRAGRRSAAAESATARGILAGIDLMRADYPAAVGHAEVGARLDAGPSPTALNLTFLAAAEADTAKGSVARQHLTEALALAEASRDPIRIGYAAAYAGQARLLDGDASSARAHLEGAVSVFGSALVLQPWPLALLAEVDLLDGDLEAASGHAARAAATAATTDIAYQRALALRAEGLVAAATARTDVAVERLTQALRQARRTTGEGYAFHWPVAWILESLARVTSVVDVEASHRWAVALADHATTVGMETFVRRGEQLAAG